MPVTGTIERLLTEPNMTFSLAVRILIETQKKASGQSVIDIARDAGCTTLQIGQVLTTIPTSPALTAPQLSLIATLLGVTRPQDRQRLMDHYTAQQNAAQDNSPTGRTARLERIALESARAL